MSLAVAFKIGFLSASTATYICGPKGEHEDRSEYDLSGRNPSSVKCWPHRRADTNCVACEGRDTMVGSWGYNIWSVFPSVMFLVMMDVGKQTRSQRKSTKKSRTEIGLFIKNGLVCHFGYIILQGFRTAGEIEIFFLIDLATGQPPSTSPNMGGGNQNVELDSLTFS